MHRLSVPVCVATVDDFIVTGITIQKWPARIRRVAAARQLQEPGQRNGVTASANTKVPSTIVFLGRGCVRGNRGEAQNGGREGWTIAGAEMSMGVLPPRHGRPPRPPSLS